MKKFFKCISILLACMVSLAVLLPGCGSKSGDDATITSADIQQTSTVASSDTNKQESTAANTPLKEVSAKKKVVIVQVTADGTREEGTKKMLKALENGGYVDGKNMEVTKIVMDFNDKAGAPVVEKIKEIKPDLVLINELLYAIPTVVTPLKDSNIPIISNANIESFVDKNGMPIYNITGMYLEPKNLQEKAFQLLNKLSPLNGKKAVFITQPGPYSKESVQNNLKSINGELKAYEEYTYVEDFEKLINKYNNDPEVGWTLLGYWPMTHKDGSNDPIAKSPGAKYWKKPTITYWENGVQFGLLCGLGVDLVEAGAQVGEMAVKVLDGENIKNIKAQEPRKTTIMINKKRADAMEIQIPNDILGSAKIYTDYEGHAMN